MRISQELTLGVHSDLLGREDIVNIFGLQPVLVQLPELVVVDLIDLPHVEDPRVQKVYSSRLSEFSSGILTAS